MEEARAPSASLRQHSFRVGGSIERSAQASDRHTMTMVGNEYVLAMLLPHGMPWSEEEDGMPFFTWFVRVFSQRDSNELWKLLGRDALGLLQQDEYVTAYPTEENSHPLMKHQKGFDAQPPDTFPYHPGACVKLILRNVRSCRADMPHVIFQKRPNPDKFWCAVRTPWLAGLSARRDSMMRSHPNTLQGVLAPDVGKVLLDIVRANLANLQTELATTAGGKGSEGGARIRGSNART